MADTKKRIELSSQISSMGPCSPSVHTPPASEPWFVNEDVVPNQTYTSYVSCSYRYARPNLLSATTRLVVDSAFSCRAAWFDSLNVCTDMPVPEVASAYVIINDCELLYIMCVTPSSAMRCPTTSDTDIDPGCRSKSRIPSFFVATYSWSALLFSEMSTHFDGSACSDTVPSARFAI